MCELFAMSSRMPTAVTYSLNEFAKYGSRIRRNRDGWGIALARDRDAFLVKEPKPAADSIWVSFIAKHPIETTVAIAHVRYATRGPHTMENTHPFRRALGRRTRFFAHNGTLNGIEKTINSADLAYVPIGDTDSELAFCALLSRLKPYYERDESLSLESRFDVFSNHCEEMKDLAPSNFFYYDGEIFLVLAHKRI